MPTIYTAGPTFWCLSCNDMEAVGLAQCDRCDAMVHMDCAHTTRTQDAGELFLCNRCARSASWHHEDECPRCKEGI